MAVVMMIKTVISTSDTSHQKHTHSYSNYRTVAESLLDSYLNNLIVCPHFIRNSTFPLPFLYSHHTSEYTVIIFCDCVLSAANVHFNRKVILVLSTHPDCCNTVAKVQNMKMRKKYVNIYQNVNFLSHFISFHYNFSDRMP